MAIQGGRPVDRQISALLFVRDAPQAFAFYQRAFETEVLLRHDPPGGGDLRIGSGVVSVLAANPRREAEPQCGGPFSPEYLGGSGTVLQFYVTDVDAAVSRAVAAGAKVIRPVEDIVTGDRIAMLQDPFGHQWLLATARETITAEEFERREADLRKPRQP